MYFSTNFTEKEAQEKEGMEGWWERRKRREGWWWERRKRQEGWEGGSR